MTMLRPSVAFALVALAACAGEPADQAAGAPDAAVVPAAPVAPATPAVAPESWRANPASAAVTRAGDTLTVRTGPHTVLWEDGKADLAPPYTVRATLQKRSGRLHEGTGIVFGGSGLEGPDAGQVYSYFLTRGDGSYLIKRRQGAETPVVRDWTRDPAIRRDAEAGGRPNELEVVVGEAEVAFRVNGRQVARVPAAELSVRGKAGLRASHDVQLVVTGFRAEPGAAAQ
jgi:hypothetical protein